MDVSVRQNLRRRLSRQFQCRLVDFDKLGGEHDADECVGCVGGRGNPEVLPGPSSSLEHGFQGGFNRLNKDELDLLPDLGRNISKVLTILFRQQD